MLRVMTYNIHGGRDPAGRLDLEAIADVIRAANPCLAALQEVHQRLPQTRYQPQAELLERWTGRFALFGPSLGFSLIGYGNALLGPGPPQRWQQHLLPSGREQRTVLEAVYLLDERPVRLLVTHLGLDPEERRAQVRVLAALARRAPEIPRLLLGDLNETPASDLLAPLFHLGLRRALPPEQPTFPATEPRVHIDEILVDDRWEVLTAETPASLASDHLPVVADLRWR